MSLKGMKKIIAIIFTMMLTPVAWGYDSAMIDNFEFRKKDGTQIAVTAVNRELGLLSMNILNTSCEYTYALIKIKATNGSWYLIDSGGMAQYKYIADTDENTPNFSAFCTKTRMSSKTESQCNLTLQGLTDIYFKTFDSEKIPSEAGWELTCLQKLTTDKFFTLVNIAQAMAYSPGGLLSASVMLYKKTGGADLYMFTWKPEYFMGERSALGSYTGESYSGKAKTILNACWPVYTDRTATDSDESPYKSGLAYAIAHDLTSVYNGKLQGSDLAVYIKNNSLPLPLKLDDKRIASILRNDYESPYISEFLRLNVDSQKTVASEFVTLADSTYEWDDYGFISEEKGKELARAALRYFTWGVEYTANAELTKVVAKDLPPKDQTPINVYCANKEICSKWLFNNGGSREDNYFDGAISTESPKYLSVICDKSSGSGRSLLDGLDSSIVQYIFKDTDSTYVPGNPVPYTAFGRDSPRSFNYKMVEQYKARVALNKIWYPNKTFRESTRAYNFNINQPGGGSVPRDEKYGNYLLLPSWVPEQDGAGMLSGYGRIKLFMPGETKSFYDAGVDEMGFLLGSIAMTSIYNDVQFVKNIEKAVTLDSYYAFKAGCAGVDSIGVGNGGPCYKNIKGRASIYESTAFSVGEIERVSALIPLKNIRVGDIVVCYGTDDSGYRTLSHAGVVLSVPSGVTNISEIIAKTKIVHISASLGQVRLDYLSNFDPSSSNDAFTVRRILATDHENTTARPTKAKDWDVLDLKPASLTVSIQKESGWERWIPNTGEYFPFKLNAKIINAAGYSIDASSILNDTTFLRIDPPIDRKIVDASLFDTESNIINNKGIGFEVVIQPANGFDKENAILVSSYTLGLGGVYKADYTNSAIFNDKGIPKSTNVIDRLTILGNKVQYKGKECVLGIRPLSSDIRPGDDIYLSFSIYKTESPSKPWVSGQCAESDYLAIYDKKMLWRANLFIDEGGRNDWNYNHPWNAPPKDYSVVGEYDETTKTWTTVPAPKWWNPEYGNNDWNWSYDYRYHYEKYMGTANPGGEYSETFDTTGKVHPTIGRGDQVLYIPDSTWSGSKGDNLTTTNYLIHNSVIYCYAQATSPFQYCEDMQKLCSEILRYWSSEKEKAKEGSVEYARAAAMVAEYTNPGMVLAPKLSKYGKKVKDSNIWENYSEYSLLPGHFQTESFHNGWLTGGLTSDEYPLEKSVIAKGLYESPFSAYNKSTGKEEPIGIDCGGLVRTSISYRGSSYLGDLKYGRNLWFDTEEKDTGLIAESENNNMFGVVSRKDITDLTKPDAKILQQMKCLVPGDIYYFSAAKGYHVAIIGYVPTAPDSRYLGNIRLTEATHQNVEKIPQGRVMVHETLLTYTEEGKPWIIGRIRHDEN